MHLTVDDAVRQELSRRYDAARGDGARSDRPAPPMSVEQRHVWLHAEAAAGVPIYNEPITVRYRGRFDRQAFIGAFDALVRRHEALRTSFAALDGDPIQIVHDDLHADFPLTDLGDLDPDAREAEALAIAARDARRPFALDRPPLFRGRLIRFADDDHRLYLTLHHIIFDGASLHQVIMPELVALYEACAEGRAPELPVPPEQYGDYALGQRQSARDDAFDDQIAYWRTQLEPPLAALDLPVDRAPSPVPSWQGALTPFHFDAALVDRLRALGRARGATLNIVMLASFIVLLHRYSGQEDIVIGGVADSRRRAERRTMIGYCLNLVPLRSRPTPDAPFASVLDQVRDTVVGAIEHKDVPFERLVRSLRLPVAGGRHPLFQTLFSIQSPGPRLPEAWSLAQHEVSSGAAKMDLHVEIDEQPDGTMTGGLTYNTDLFDRATIAAMIGHWTALLESIVAAPDTPLRLLALLSTGEGESSSRFPVKVLTIMLWSSVLLQKVAIPGNIEVPLFIMIGGLGVLVATGWAKVSLPRLMFFTLLVLSMVLSQLVAGGGRSFSFQSLLLAFPLYAIFVFVVPLARDDILVVLRRFQGIALFIAAMVALQWALQGAGIPIPNVEDWMPKDTIYHTFNYVQPLAWRAEYMKPNGFFMLEASHTSQILAMAAVIEICVFRRMAVIITLICAQLASFGGTGFVLLLACSVVFPFVLSRRTMVLLIGGALLVVAGASQTAVWKNFSSRTTELNKPNSSGNGRFIAPYGFMVDMLTKSRTAIVSGIGPGNGKESKDSDQLVMNPVVKAIAEYGLFVGVIWMLFIHGCVLRTAAPAIAALAVIIQYDFLNGSLLVPIHLVYCYILAGAYPRRAEDRAAAAAEGRLAEESAGPAAWRRGWDSNPR
ncbi:MAG: condensation domain-containing protein [Sphingomonas sp.]